MKSEESQIQQSAVEQIEHIFKMRWPRFLLPLEHTKKINGKSVKYTDMESPLHTIPNGGKRHIKVAMEMRREGLKTGLEDLFLPIRSKEFTGLYIEVKKSKGYQSKNQKIWQAFHISQGAQSVVCKSVDSIVMTVLQYMEGL